MNCTEQKRNTLANLSAILIGMGAVLIFVWVFDYIYQLYIAVVITIVVGILIFLLFFRQIREQAEFEKVQKSTILYYLSPAGFLLLPASDQYLIPFFTENTSALLVFASLVAASPVIWIYWKIANREALLIITAVLTVGVVSLYLVLPVIQSGEALGFLFVPLPFVMYLGIAWVLSARLSLERARQSRSRPVMKPAMESLTMFLLIIPLVVFAMLSARVATNQDFWVAVAGIIVSFLFSSTVSTPFMKFLRALAEFDKESKHTEQAGSPHSNT